MPTIKPWLTKYPTAIDTITEMPTLVSGQDITQVSQIHALRDSVISLQTAVGSDLLETGSLRGSPGGVPGDYAISPTTPNADDDEFLTSTLDVSWTRNYTASATVLDPYANFDVGDTREDMNNRRPSWFVLQPDNQGAVRQIYKTVTLGTDAFVWTRVKVPSTVITPISSGEGETAISLHDDAAGPSSQDRLILSIQYDSGAGTQRCVMLGISGGVVTNTTQTGDFSSSGPTLEYLGIQKVGSTYHCWAWAGSGSSFYMGAHSPGANDINDIVGLSARGTQSAGALNHVFGFDFFRRQDDALFIP